MRTLADRVRRTIVERRLAGPSGRVVAAVSGGPDSVAMVHLLRALEPAGMLRLVGVAHFNHQLREAAPADEAFCRDLASDLSLPIDVESADVAALAADRGVSIEVAGRDARYAFLARAAERAGADRVAVGHTADDQAETFLLRLVRGAGARGLAAIRPRAGLVIRPLIEVRRAEVHAYLAARGLAFREDASNRDVANPRNLIRHDVLPHLARAFGVDLTGVLAREAAIAEVEAAWIDACAIETEAGVVLEGDEGPALDLRGLRALHPAMARRVVHRALARVGGGRFVGFDHVEAVLGLAARGRGGIDLPGQRAVVAAGRVRLIPACPGADRRTGRRAVAPGPDPVPLPIPGRAELAGGGWVVTAEPVGPDGVQSQERPSDALTAVVSFERPADPVAGAGLWVRTRRPGDRLRLPGGAGRKKVQDLFVDRKVPRDGRDRVPLVVHGDGRIVWVVGVAVSGDFRVTDPSRAVILLKASRLGGQG